MKRMSKENARAWLNARKADYTFTAQKLGESYGDVPRLNLDYGEDLRLVETSGGEGDGAPMSKVFLVTVSGEEFYFRIEGTYSSWDASEWDSTFEIVEPREVVVVKYFQV